MEHTGDVGIRYYGNSLEELFSNAVEGTAHLIGDPGKNCTRKSQSIKLKFTSNQDLLYQLLDRMIYFFEVEEVLYDRIESLRFPKEGEAHISLSGCVIDERFEYHYIMKAPTYHQMEINVEKGYGVQIFDI